MWRRRMVCPRCCGVPALSRFVPRVAGAKTGVGNGATIGGSSGLIGLEPHGFGHCLMEMDLLSSFARASKIFEGEPERTNFYFRCCWHQIPLPHPLLRLGQISRCNSITIPPSTSLLTTELGQKIFSPIAAHMVTTFAIAHRRFSLFACFPLPSMSLLFLVACALSATAEDADSLESEDASRKKEGAFYVWHSSEGKNVLIERNATLAMASKHGLPVERYLDSLGSNRRKLFEVRTRRPRPHLDDKVIVSWNGLAISSFARASKILKGEPERTNFYFPVVGTQKDLAAWEADLKRRERDIKHREDAVAGVGVPVNDKNWPPFLPISNHDIVNEIPVESHKMIVC
nr:spermatogenesis-associated protein 20 [Ipomoea batatas]